MVYKREKSQDTFKVFARRMEVSRPRKLYK